MSKKFVLVLLSLLVIFIATDAKPQVPYYPQQFSPQTRQQYTMTRTTRTQSSQGGEMVRTDEQVQQTPYGTTRTQQTTYRQGNNYGTLGKK